MLDDFKNSQPIAYKLFVNSVKKNKQIHAYLIETNECINREKVVLAFAKYLLCPLKKTDISSCVNCTQCQNIDKNLFPELKIINPDGIWIKKGQLEELQKEFSVKSVYSDKKIYIINHADKLNISAANSILKFLEEPEEGIIAILVVDNLYQLLPTIKSRCQIITLKNDVLENNQYNQNNKIKQFINKIDIDNNELDRIIEISFNFIKTYETKGIKTLLTINDLWLKNLKDKEQMLLALEIIILIYMDAINYKINNQTEIFNNNLEDIIKISEQNSSNVLCNKVKTITNIKDKFKINANNSLLMDKLLITLERVNKND